MCGIIGYVGASEAVPILIDGLSRLEYRGYDSAGIACLGRNGSALLVMKEKGKLKALRQMIEGANLSSSIGVGHTRWATHGEPSRVNAHPHTDCRRQLALVHNGIVENYESLRKKLIQKGHRFKSETDTEVLVHLIEDYDRGDLLGALRRAVKEIQGFFAFVLISAKEPGKLFVFKRSNPLVVGLGKGENFIASDVPALLPHTRKVVFLEDDEFAVIQRSGVQIFSLKSQTSLKRRPSEITWSVSQAQKGGFRHFMLKEIHEQPRVLAETIAKRLDARGNIYFDTLSRKVVSRLCRIKKVSLVSCGTAYHAGILGNYMIERYARLSVQAAVSSEFRYEDPILDKQSLVILITQSGETADTLAALREAKKKGAFTLAIVNVVGSTIAREADAVVYTHAGPEIGVASTKAYTAQLITLILLTLYLAELRLGRIKKEVSRPEFQKLVREMKALCHEIRNLPRQAETTIKLEKAIENCARKHRRRKNFLYLGRGYNYPNALEGALKLKEITYAHAHGYPAGEMKHGPIALIDDELPVICLAPESRTYEKMISNIEEIRARGGIVVAVGTEGDRRLENLASDFFAIPRCPEVFSPILTVIPLQLFAYKVAALNGRDVDQPRNLAKSVTVE